MRSVVGRFSFSRARSSRTRRTSQSGPSMDFSGVEIRTNRARLDYEKLGYFDLLAPSAAHEIDSLHSAFYEQLEIARRNTPEVMQRFGHSRANAEFLKGYIERLVFFNLNARHCEFP